MRKTLFFILGFSIIVVALAHEYILLATKYRLGKGEVMEMRLFVADGFNIEMEGPYRVQPTKALTLVTKDSIINLMQPQDGPLPFLKRSVNFDGGGLVHLERNYARITMATEKFLSYVKEDHLDGIAPKVDKNKAEQKERYTRYVKSLVQSGTNYNDTVYKTITGQTLEIVLLNNPYQLNVNDVLKVRILYLGKPLANRVITARNRTGSEPSIAILSTTNAKGECSFKMKRKGEWFVHLTHMIECADKTDSDWESFWASYSFEID